MSLPLTLDRLVRASAERAPEAPAVILGDERLSYRELDRQATVIAGVLEAMGVVPGDRVGLYLAKSPRAVAAIVGVLRAGAAYVPVDPSAPPDRARFVFEHCEVSAVIGAGLPLAGLLKSGPAVAPRLAIADRTPVEDAEAAGWIGLTRLDDALGAPMFGLIANEPRREGGPPIDTDLAYVLYTSGSTGRPKGVAITHGQSLAFVRPAAAVFELEPNDVLVSHAPFNFDLSVIDLFCTFLAGASVVLIPERSLAFPAKVAELFERHAITVWNSVPSALIQLVNHGSLAKRDLSRLRLIMFAGEPYPPKHLRALRAAAPKAKLLNIYGQTEANSSTYYPIAAIPEADDAPIPIGKPFPNYQVFALDLDGRPIAEPNVEGELFVRGGAVACGYFKDPERTQAAFVQNPLEPRRTEIVYKTGDRVRYDERADLIFLGRADAVIKVRGFRVELGEVESIVGAEATVAEAALIPVPDEEATHRLVLFVAPSPGAALEETAIQALLAKKVPRYMVPERVAIEPSLPRTPNGKIDRRALTPRARDLLSS